MPQKCANNGEQPHSKHHTKPNESNKQIFTSKSWGYKLIVNDLDA